VVVEAEVALVDLEEVVADLEEFVADLEEVAADLEEVVADLEEVAEDLEVEEDFAVEVDLEVFMVVVVLDPLYTSDLELEVLRVFYHGGFTLITMTTTEIRY
jgi:hypothetical protein